MVTESSTPRSRRALLAAAAAAIGVAATDAVAPRATTRAANGDALIVGSLINAATATTKLATAAMSVDTLVIEATNGTAITGKAGSGGIAVRGDATSSVGIVGTAITGMGVSGFADSGVGVSGFSPAGTGVDGYSPGGTGTGVRARAGTGLALSVEGKAHFSRSGRTWIRTGQGSLTVTLVGTTANSRVFAVLASNRPGRYVRAVVPATDKFTVYVNSAVSSDAVVTWFVLD